MSFGGASRHAPPRVISVDLVAPPSSASARARPAPAPPPPAPREAAAPAPAPPKPRQVVLPEKPQKPPEPRPRREPREVFAPPPKQQEKSLEELLAEMRDGAGEAPPEPRPAERVETAAAPSPGAVGGSGAPLSPEELAWHRAVKRRLKGFWVVPPGFRTQPLETQVEVTLDSAGNLLGEPRITSRSGNPWFDEGVVRGLNKANPLPPPPEAGEWTLWFRPTDSL